MSTSLEPAARAFLRRVRALVAVEPVFRSLGLLPAPWRWPAYARLVGGNPYSNPADGDDRETVRRILPHGYRMRLSRRDWRERYALRVGHYWDPLGISVMQRLLRPGDAVLDIGANLGFLTLAAARLVGPVGRVVAVEPNPFLAKRLSEILEMNAIDNVRIAATALGDADGSLTMLLPEVGHGRGRVTAPSADAVTVPVGRGDGVFTARQGERVFVKIDVEGYETRVLDGLPEVLRHPDLACLVEVTDAWLRDQGSSAAALFEIMRRNGLRGMRPRLSLAGRALLEPLPAPADSFQYDALFVKGSFAGDRA